MLSLKELIVHRAIEWGNDPKAMLALARCESTFRQFKDGEVLRGLINPLDVGLYQINEGYHLADAIRLGYDIHTLEGNTAYANWLVKRQGYKPWNSSNHCHQLLSTV